MDEFTVADSDGISGHFAVTAGCGSFVRACWGWLFAEAAIQGRGEGEGRPCAIIGPMSVRMPPYLESEESGKFRARCRSMRSAGTR